MNIFILINYQDLTIIIVDILVIEYIFHWLELLKKTVSVPPLSSS